jgi:hypothetical protein
MNGKEDKTEKKENVSQIENDPKLEKIIKCSEKPPKDTIDFEIKE